MGKLLQTFTYPRNAFAATTDRSAEKALKLLSRVDKKQLLGYQTGQIKDEAFNDARLFLAIAGGPPNEPYVTAVGDHFRVLAKQSEVSAWRWLLTRSMWLYSIPNESNVSCNQEAAERGLRFNFFDLLTRLTVHFSALPAPQNVLYFDELLAVLDDDGTWGIPHDELFRRVLMSRQDLKLSEPGGHAGLLSELEPFYGVSRDYLNTVFRKAMGQCGLFTITGVGQQVLGIKLDPATYANPVLAERLRFVLDHPRIYKA